MKDVRKVFKVKIYMKDKRRPIILYSDKDEKEFMLDIISRLETSVVINIGPLIFSTSEFSYLTIE